VASEELKKTEIIIFEKENKEYELEIKLKDDKGLILHLKRINYEKEHELQDEEERLRRLEEEIEEDLSVTQYSLNESKKRLKELEQKREEAKHRE
jgi:small-conductance mechanosensitive channel